MNQSECLAIACNLLREREDCAYEVEFVLVLVIIGWKTAVRFLRSPGVSVAIALLLSKVIWKPLQSSINNYRSIEEKSTRNCAQRSKPCHGNKTFQDSLKKFNFAFWKLLSCSTGWQPLLYHSSQFVPWESGDEADRAIENLLQVDREQSLTRGKRAGKIHAHTRDSDETWREGRPNLRWGPCTTRMFSKSCACAGVSPAL